ncbi:hypothetical protein CB1_000365098 [Camelus ferus]|nr:hypothetical protein CB1_000365098 [Camelus ferus]
MAARQKEMIADEVHQNQILRELYLKELRTQKLYTQYHVNPLRKGAWLSAHLCNFSLGTWLCAGLLQGDWNQRLSESGFTCDERK